MKRILILWLLPLIPFLATSQNCGLEDTLWINPNSTQTFSFEIFDVVNDDLSDPNQGVCGVEINFAHQFSENLQLWLTAPDGTMVQLIGDNTTDQFAFTFFANWDITFVPCTATAMPDSGHVPQWNNDQPNNFVAGGLYYGSYYPFSGCLENFATGPVNGTWTITTTNNPSIYAGAIIDFRVVLCDPLGQNCCFSEAGNLLGYDTLAVCEGDSLLELDLSPTFGGNGQGPDTTLYSYTYAIAESGNLIAFDSIPDLRTYPPGNYEVCGLSFRRSDMDSLPMPDGTLPLTMLRDTLDLPDPPFCGDLTDSCVVIYIAVIPDPVLVQDTICAGDSYMLGDSTFTANGQYDVVLESVEGCDSLINLELTVLEIPVIDLEATICEGDTFQVGSSIYMMEGLYADTLQTTFGCDSIINLNLTVLEPVFESLTAYICLGNSYSLGDSTFTEAGMYDIPLISSQGCDSIVQLTLNVLAPQALILPPDTIDCVDPMVLLDGSGSTPGGALEYSWMPLGSVMVLGTDPTLLVDAPGFYELVVTQTEGGVSCAVSDTIEVLADTQFPVADAGSPATLNCQTEMLVLGGPGTTAGPDFSYSWTTNGGNFLDPTTIAEPTVNGAGDYTLIVTNTTNGCSDTAMVTIAVDTIAPIALAGTDFELNCVLTEAQLDGTASSQGPEFGYSWTSVEGVVPMNENTLEPTVSEPASYILTVQNVDNFCESSDTIVVSENVDLPEVLIASPDTLNCVVESIQLDASGTDTGANFTINWMATAGGMFLAGTDGLMPTVGAAGTYTLIVENTSTLCVDSLAVMVVDTVNTVVAEANVSGMLDCTTLEVTLSANNSTSGPDILYCWSTLDGNFVADSVGISVLVDAPGLYQLIAKDTFTLCADTTEVSVIQEIQPPNAAISQPPILNCALTQDTLFSIGQNTNPESYLWTGPCIITDETAASIIVECPGTYTLEITDQVTGCTNMAAVEVLIDSISPTVVIAEPSTLNCAASSLILDASGTDNGTPFVLNWQAMNGGNILSGQGSLMPVADAAGDYELTVLNTENQCSTSFTVSVIDTFTTIVADPGLGGLINCNQPSLQLNAGGSVVSPDVVFEWSTTDGNIVGNSLMQVITVNDRGTYTLIVTDTITFCADTASVSILQDTIAPIAEAGTGFTLNCALVQDTLWSVGSSVGAQFSYSWSGPCIVGADNEVNAVVECAGVYYLSVTNMSNGCTSIDSVEVLENVNTPMADAGEGQLLTCDITEVTLDGSASSVGSQLVYSWEGPGIVSGVNNLIVTVNAIGEYSLIVTDTVNFCRDTSTVMVDSYTNQPLADAGPPQTITCINDTLTIGGAGTSVGPNIIYEWFTAEGQIVEGVDSNFALVDTSGVYVLFVTDTLSGCADTAFVAINTNLEIPSLNTGPDLEIDCSTTAVELEATTNTDISFLDISWEGDCIETNTDQLAITVSCPGIYTIQLTDTRNGCSRTDMVEVRYDSLAPIAVLADTTLLSCESGVATIDGSGSTAGFYQWLFEGNPTLGNGNTLEVTETGIYSLIVTNLDQSCSDTASTLVIVDCAVFAAVAEPDTLTCTNLDVVLDGSASSSGSQISYFWRSDEPGCIVTGQGSPSVTVSCSGFYTLVVTNSAIPISDSVTVFVPIDTMPPIADAGPSDTLTCLEPFAILNGANSSTGPDFTYQWTRSLFEVVSNQLVDTVFESGNYFLEVTDTTNGCSAQDGMLVLNAITDVQVNFSSALFPCNQDTFDLQAIIAPTGNNYEIEWSGPGIVAGANNNIVRIDTAGLYTISVLDTVNQCSVLDTITVTEQVCLTCVDIETPDTLTCIVDTIFINASYCAPCINCTLEWNTSNGEIVGGQGTLQLEVAAPGTYELTVTDTLGIATVFSTVVIRNTETPIADAGEDQELNCSDISVPLGGPGSSIGAAFSYSWDTNSGQLPDPDDMPNTQVAFPGDYYLIVINQNNGCFSIDTVRVSQDTIAPVAEAGPIQEITCAQSVAILSGTGSSVGDAINYQWSGPTGASITGATSLNPIVNTAGMYYLMVTDTSNACQALDSVEVRLNTSLPVLPMLLDTQLNCRDTLIILDAMTEGTTGLSYNWCQMDGNMPINCMDTDIIAVGEPGRFRFEITIDSTACTNTLIIEVGIDTIAPILEAGASDTLFCDLNSLELGATVVPDDNTVTVNWEGPVDAILSGATSLTPTINAPGTYHIFATSQTNYCSSQDSVIILSDENAPSVEAGVDTLLNCIQTEVELNGSGSTVSGQQTISWTTEEGQIISGGSTFSPIVGGAPAWYCISLTDNVNGCTTKDSVFVSIDTIAPQALLSGAGELLINCYQDTLQLSGVNSTSLSGNPLFFDWMVLEGGGLLTTATDSLIQIIDSGTFQLVVTDSKNGCRDSLEFVVEEDFELPEVIISEAGPLSCELRALILDATESSSGPTFSPVWTTMDGSGIIDAASLMPTITGPGTYLLTITNTINGCSLADSIEISLDTIAPTVFIAVPQILNCNLLQVALDGTGSSQGPQYTYTWSTDAGGILSGQDSIIAITELPGSYTLVVENEDNGCMAEFTREVLQTEVPITDVFLRLIPPTCIGDSDASIFIDSIEGGTAPYVYSFNGGDFSTLNSFNNLAPGVYELSIQDLNGCEWNEQVEIIPPEEITIDLGPDIEIELGDSIQLNAIVNVPYDTLFWTASVLLADPSNPVQVVRPLETAYFSVTAIDSNGCMALDRIVISLHKPREIFIPTAFSPNNDGNNDRFMIFAGPDVLRINTFQIFDRWGNKVFGKERFLPNDPTYGWDGNFNGTPMNAAVYVFWAEVEFIDGWIELIKGDVLLMR